MIDREEALRTAVARIAWATAPGDVLFEEYEDGFVAREKPGRETDEDGLPRVVGQGCLVIDRTDGRVYEMPYVGPDATIQKWRKLKDAGKI